MNSIAKEFRRKIIVLCPIKNEGWILKGFIESTLLWADQIIFSVQASSDNTVDILRGYSRVEVIENSSLTYNESENRKALLHAARNHGGENLLISLDADERLSPEILSLDIREKLLELEPGTGVTFKLANIRADLEEYWEVPMAPSGFIDDGREPDTTDLIHFPRTCFTSFPTLEKLEFPKVVHLQFVDENRLRTKQAWYQMWELINLPRAHPANLYRRYHHMDSISGKLLRPIPDFWRLDYKALGVDLFEFQRTDELWWANEINDWLKRFGLKFFSKLNIDFVAADVNKSRSPVDAIILQYLTRTQKYYTVLAPTPLLAALMLTDFLIDIIWSRLGSIREPSV